MSTDAVSPQPKLYVIHENPEWYAPLAAAFDAAGLPHEPWLLGDATIDLDAEPPAGVFWSRMSASSHTRGHPFAKDQTRGVLAWLEAAGRRVVNGRRVIDLEMSKVEQLAALRAAGFDVPRTIAVAGRDGLAAAAKKLPVPFIAKHNQGGKGLGVRLFASHADFDAYLAGPDDEPPVDGITLLQEYLVAARAADHQSRDRRRRVHLRDHRGHRARRLPAVPGRRLRGQPRPAARPPRSRACSRSGPDSTIR